MELLMSRRKKFTVFLEIDPSNQSAGATTVFDRTGINTINRAGTVTVSDDGPLPGVKSLVFNAADGRDYFAAPYKASWPNILKGDFTVELWFKRSSNSLRCALFGNWIQAVGQGGVNIFVNTDGSLSFGFGPYSEGASIIISSAKPALNQWHHVAFTRSGNTFRAFIDGVLDTTATSSATRGLITAAMAFGAYQNSSGGYPDSISGAFTGSMTRMRITQGAARYLTNFVPTY